jgi:hypothetical protein
MLEAIIQARNVAWSVALASAHSVRITTGGIG